jgi:hypothetical protein
MSEELLIDRLAKSLVSNLQTHGIGYACIYVHAFSWEFFIVGTAAILFQDYLPEMRHKRLRNRAIIVVAHSTRVKLSMEFPKRTLNGRC